MVGGGWLAGAACNALSGVGDYSFDAPTTTAMGTGGGAGSTTSTTSTSSTASGTGGTGVGGSTGTGTAAGGGGGAGGEGAGPTWVVVDSLTVPVDGSSVESTFALAFAGTYRLRASGTANVNNAVPWIGDAEYFDFSDVPTSLKDVGAGVDMGLAVDDDVVDDVRSPRWGDYDPTHVYEIDFAATGSTISASYHDLYTYDNEGSLTLEILSWQ